MKPGDRLVCAFVEPIAKAATFTDWPLHVTIVPWFRLDQSSSNLALLLLQNFTDHAAFTVYVRGENQFGYKKQKTVNLVSASQLLVIESQTRQVLHKQHAWIVDEADHTQRSFRPHVTVQRSRRVQEGDQFHCNRLYIISQQGNSKSVDEVIPL